MKQNSFAHACAETCSLGELVSALKTGADTIDMETWGITSNEWLDGVEAAIFYLMEA